MMRAECVDSCITKKNQFTARKIVIVTLVLIDFIACLPLFMDFLPSGHDLVFHLYRIEGIAQGIKQGQGIVRLQFSQLDGFGYPVSVMYGDVLLYPVAFLRVLGLSVESCYRVYVLAVNSMTIVITYFVAKRISQSRSISLLACSLWTFSPYRLECVYLRASLGEYTALMFIPIIIMGLYYLFIASPENQARNAAFIWLSLGATGIIVTHILSVILVVVALAIPFIGGLIVRHNQYVFMQLALSLLVVAALSSFFLIPFIDYYLTMPMSVTDISAAQSRVNAAQHAVEPAQLFTLFSQMAGGSNSVNLGINGEMPLAVGWSIWLSVALFVFAFVISKKKAKFMIPTVLLCTALVIGWMTTVFFPWQRHLPFGNSIISFISSIQFPWRFIGPLTALLVIIGCCGVVLIRQTEFKVIAPICVAILIGLSMIEGGFAITTFLNSSAPIWSFSISASDPATLGIMNGEYLPADVNRERLIASIQSGNYPATDGTTLEKYEENGTSVTLFVDSSTEGGTVDLPLLWYKYYQVQTTSGQICHMSAGPNGVIRLTMPQGFSDTVLVSFVEPMSWTASAWISGLTCIILLIYGIRRMIKRRKNVECQ